MANLSSVKTKITVEATRFRSAVSEFLIQTIGKSINFLIDRINAVDAQQFQLITPVYLQNSDPGTNLTLTVASGSTFIGTFSLNGTGDANGRFSGSVAGIVTLNEQNRTAAPAGLGASASVGFTTAVNITADSSSGCTKTIAGILINNFTIP